MPPTGSAKLRPDLSFLRHVTPTSITSNPSQLDDLKACKAWFEASVNHLKDRLELAQNMAEGFEMLGRITGVMVHQKQRDGEGKGDEEENMVRGGGGGGREEPGMVKEINENGGEHGAEERKRNGGKEFQQQEGVDGMSASLADLNMDSEGAGVANEVLKGSNKSDGREYTLEELAQLWVGKLNVWRARWNAKGEGFYV